MKLLRSSAAQSGFFSRISFLLGAAFIYALLLITPASAEDTTSPSTPTSTEPSPSQTQEQVSEPASTSTPTLTPVESVDTSSLVLPTIEFETSSQPNLATEPSLVFEPVAVVSEPTSTNTESPLPESPEVTSVPNFPLAITSQTLEPAPVVEETVTGGGDDVSYRIPLTTTVIYDGVEFSDVFATTNSVITFGNPDNTYWTYPSTPSISINSIDWWVRPHLGDEHFIIRTSEGGFQVDMAARPFGNNSNEVTNIVITAQIRTNGEVSYSYSVTGPTYENIQRTGARLTDGSIVTLEEAGIQQVEEPVVLEPTPVEPEAPTEEEPQPPLPPAPAFDIVLELQLPFELPQEPTPEPPVEPGPSQDGEEDDTPSDTPVEPESPQDETPSSENPSTDSGSTTEPDKEEPQQPIEEPESDSESEQTPETDPTEVVFESEEESEQELPKPKPQNPLQESSEDTSALEAAVSSLLKKFVDGMAVPVSELIANGVGFSDLPPETPVELRTDTKGNPVIITAEVAAALEVLESPAELFNTLLDNPSQALMAFANVGADMSEAEREQAQETVVAAVIAAGAAISAAATRMGRK